VKEVQEYLDIREINGYSIQYTLVHPADYTQKPFRCMVYIGLPSNPQFLGVQEPEKLARHIWKSRGPSGENKEYLFMLEEALRGLGGESGDEHVKDLTDRVRVLENEENRFSGEKVRRDAVSNKAERVESNGAAGEQEEVEK
jgi:cation transport protein ChaC